MGRNFISHAQSLAVDLLTVMTAMVCLACAATPATAAASSIPNTASVTPPIADALSRVTKKTFGLYVSPGHSPVSPERFRGYHTGADFETFDSEQANDVPISAICTGPLALKKWATGYGGVAVQRCRIENQNVTVIYGHLRLNSIAAKLGRQIKQGQQIGLLGKGYSHETGGERKHLHLGIHKGTSINILGYVAHASSLKNWIDVMTYLNPPKQ